MDNSSSVRTESTQVSQFVVLTGFISLIPVFTGSVREGDNAGAGIIPDGLICLSMTPDIFPAAGFSGLVVFSEALAI